MTTMLRTCLAYESDETALSWLGRLAAVETGQPVNRILADLGVDRMGFLAGKRGPVRDFATAIGMDPATLLDGAFRILPRETAFRGEGLSKDFAAPWVRKVCLHCLRDDGQRKAWRHRILWCFRVAHSCPIHNDQLTDLDDRQAVDIRTLPVSKALDRQRQISADPVQTPRYLDWLDHRIARRNGHDDWTDGQTLEQVLAASEVLGAVLDYGHGVRLHSLSADKRGNALETGFGIYVDGPASIRSAIDDIRVRAGTKAAQAGPLAMYGRLFDWLAARSSFADPGPIRDILRDHIIEHSAVDRGETVLGEVVTERRFHSLGSLVEATGLTRRRLFLLLQKLGYVDQGATIAECGDLVFPVGEVETICADLADPILLHDVAAYIGASNAQALALYRSGVFRPIFPAEERGEIRRIVFARRHLDDFLARITALPVRTEDDDRRFGTVALACQGGAGPTSALVSAILAGKRHAVREKGVPGIKGIRVVM